VVAGAAAVGAGLRQLVVVVLVGQPLRRHGHGVAS
jgi:hypothetical protein